MPTELEWAYFAGLIDGDGHFGIHLPITKKGIIQITPLCQIGLAKTEAFVLEELKQIFGGYISYSNKANAVFLSFRKRQELKTMIPKLLPYLRIKRKNAILVAEAICILDGINDNKWVPRNKNIILQIAKLREELSRSSHKGGPLKWNYERLKNFLDSHSSRYSEANREKARSVRKNLGKNYGRKAAVLNHERALTRRMKHPLFTEVQKLHLEGIGWRKIAKKLNIKGYLARWLYREPYYWTKSHS